MVTVFSEPVQRRYTAPACSLSFCFSLATLVGAVLAPFYVAFASRNFWLKKGTLWEQPQLQFKYDMLLLLHGISESDGETQTWAWASNEDVRDVYEPYLRAPLIRAWPEDDNLDGLADRWTLAVHMPLDADEKVMHVQAVAAFDYSLLGSAELDMDGLVYVDYSSPLPGRGLQVEGEARLHQRAPLSVRRANANPMLRFNAGRGLASMRSSSVGAMMASYAKRNFTMVLANEYKVWEVSRGADSFQSTAGGFALNLTVHVPVDELTYTPDLAEVLKFAWIQYLALFALFFALIYAIRQFVFSNQVLETLVESESRAKHVQFKEHRF
ncbi:Transmembrane protein 231 [Hondaea fermentalgiana]|uniref:Transmembrane protein 231 n=1 Tax=Hondaea fermentalgiana TaxID=2315210 RepID=A0A2R5GGF9_9STRA|nr:Transmembrane protein 231 [Hondaea fermentalgiana]|eukprot:GBG29960.1 Transmembrane protein 231 [Hondaea fermentalgiana]